MHLAAECKSTPPRQFTSMLQSYRRCSKHQGYKLPTNYLHPCTPHCPTFYFVVTLNLRLLFWCFQGQPSGAAPEPSGPGVAEVTSVDGSIVMVLKPNELTKKKRKFKQVRWSISQVVRS